MLRSIDISIDNPCKENFNDFQPTAQGGYCQACAKEVIDFSGMTDEQLFDFFKNQKGKVCGRFLPQQLGTIANPKKKINANSWLRFAPLLSLFPFLLPAEGRAQTTVSSELMEKKNIPGENIPIAPPDSVTITGKIIYAEDDAELPGVNVYLKRSGFGTISGEGGVFNFVVTGNEKDSATLVFSFIGMKTIEKEIDITQKEINLGELKMKVDEEMMSTVVAGGVTSVHRWSPRGIWYRIKNFFRR